jgi:DNA-binding transcriptional ArsR family regulator
MAEIITPTKTVDVTFSLEPAYSGIGSLSLLDMADDFSGLGEWVYQTAEALTPEQRHTNRLILHDAYIHLVEGTWPSFPKWLDDLAAQDAASLRDRALTEWLRGVSKKIEGDIPASAELIADRSLYLSLVEKYLHVKGTPFESTFWEEVHNLLSDPQERLNLTVTHLRAMWDLVLEQEWERNLSLLEQSITAFESLDLSGLTAAEALDQVVLRAQIPQESMNWLANLERITFIPSAHTGPYLIQLSGPSDTSVNFLFGARIPEGARMDLPALSRSELLMRLNALANDTRLSILELLGQTGELGTPEIIAKLELSQSAGARHLEHLTATGFLITRRHQGTNLYRLNPDRIDYTFQVLKESVT